MSSSNSSSDSTSTTSTSSKKQAAKDKKLREKYAKEMENFEKTSNIILEKVRNMGVSVHAPHPNYALKQSPEQISDIHILYSQQIPEYVKEGTDDSEEQEKKAKSSSSDDDDDDDDD